MTQAARMDAGELEYEAGVLRATFRQFLGDAGREFGSLSLQVLGLCDGREGVQWNAYVRSERGAFLGVNLEGMKYDRWPVARLIERERNRPDLFTVLPSIPCAGEVEVYWWRDCWQGAGRVAIQEHPIPPMPVPLDQLTLRGWRQALDEAWECLDPERDRKGRRLQRVTLAGSGGSVQREVSPHLQFVVHLWGRAPQTENERQECWRAAWDNLEPIYTFIQVRSGANAGE